MAVKKKASAKKATPMTKKVTAHRRAHDLAHSKVYRGPATTRDVVFEVVPQCHVSKARNALIFEFSLASKGGGDTFVEVEIRAEDFAPIFEEIAIKLPENVGALIDAVSIASARNLERR